MSFSQSEFDIGEDGRRLDERPSDGGTTLASSPQPSMPPVIPSEAPSAMSFDLSVPVAGPPAEVPANGMSNGGAAGSGTTDGEVPPTQKHSREGLVGVLIAAGVFLFKFKALILAALFKLKYVLVVLKFGKMFSTMATMLLSIGVYATVWGWRFATGFVLLTFVHEMGHVLVAWKKKLPVSAPMFIPFMGAFITLKQHPQDALTEAHIGYGGPALGAVGDTLAVGCYFLTGNPVFLAVASFSMMVNLFNLMPVSPLDGGRIVTAISPRLWLLGLIGMTIGFFYTHSPIMLLVIIFGGIRLWSQWKTLHTDEYFAVAPRTRFTMALLYIGLVLYLGIGHYYAHNMVEDWLKTNPASDPQIRV
jgi:Zn-dependent protease